MLPPGMQLPHLKLLELTGHESMRHKTANITAEDIAHIATACPALDTLRLVHVLAGSAAVAALSQLGGLAPEQPALTALEVAGAACDDRLSLSAAAVVVQLTSLRSLMWDDSSEQLSGLQLLTALKDSTELKLPQWQRSGRPVTLQEKAGRPKVHIQLQQLCDASQVPSSWLQLPAPTLLRILGLLDTKQLARCARVCKAWCAAATSGAVNAVAVATVKSVANMSLMRWLAARAEHLCSLDLFYERTPGLESPHYRDSSYGLCRSPLEDPPDHLWLDLPCSSLKLTQLSTLRLHKFQLGNFNFADSSATQANGNTGGAAPLSGLKPSQGLQELLLNDCEVTLDALHQLEQLTGLTRLQLADTWGCSGVSREDTGRRLGCSLSDSEEDEDCGVMQVTGSRRSNDIQSATLAAYGRLLQACSALVDLELLGADTGLFACLGSIQSLRRLCLQPPANRNSSSSMVALSDLPTTLTSLVLGTKLHFVLGGLSEESQYARLQELTLTGVRFEMEALQRLSGLQHLSLSNCVAITQSPDGSQWNWRDWRTAWLLALGHLTQLRHLQLTDMGLGDVAELQHVTALAASSQLTVLQVTTRNFNPHVLPKMALQHMLPPGKQLPQLKRLELTLTDHNYFGNYRGDVTADDLAHIATACPALDTLHLVHVLADSAAMAALSQLGGLAPGQPALTALEVAGAACDDNSAAAVAKLTSLRSLVWGRSPLSRSGLQHLAALQGLSMLRFTGWKRVGRGMRPIAGGAADLTLQTKAGRVPVCMQLRQLCEAPPVDPAVTPYQDDAYEPEPDIE